MGSFHNHKGGSRAKGGKIVENYGFPMLENFKNFPKLKKKKKKKTGHALMKCVWNVTRRANAVLEPKKG